MLVIDDECDEASVSVADDAVTPERITEVWSRLGQQVAYVGFTATPAANLLQDPSSRLFPGNFVLALRTPGEASTTLSYLESNPDRRYTGGHAFYQLLDSRQRPNFLVQAQMSSQEFDGATGHDEALEDALVAYFVAGAIRLIEQKLPGFEDPENLPEAHTMLAHTESTIASHWRLCTRIIGIVRTKGGRPGEIKDNIARVRPQDRVAAEDLERWVEAEPERWRNWFGEFKRSRNILLEISPDRVRGEFPEWDEVRRALRSVFQAVKLRVVNSDDTAVDAPLQFQPTYNSHGSRLPRDIYSIVIGGNRLSRGLTMEGLCISYYTRAALKLVEDTTVQRERWFGYRGRYLEFCRVFTHRSLAIRLRRFHEHDEDLRRQLAWNIANHRTPVDATFRFLTIRDSIPTSKLGRGQGPLRLDVSGNRVFIDRVQVGEDVAELAAAAQNQKLAEEVSQLVHANGRLLTQGGIDLGFVLEAIPAQEIAALLNRFVYTFHNPDPVRGVGWNLREFYRAYDSGFPITDYGFPPSSDPYLIAAFIKFWAHAYQVSTLDPGANQFRASDSVSDWRPCPPPAFNLAIRYGSMSPAESSPFDFLLLDREVDVDGTLGSRWGGRRGGIGDEWIDVSPPSGDSAALRSRDMPGLVLMHVIGRQASGRKGLGNTYSFERPCVGMVIPAGGPCIEVVTAEGAT